MTVRADACFARERGQYYHISWCKYAEKTRELINVYYDSEHDAIMDGKQLCEACKIIKQESKVTPEKENKQTRLSDIIIEIVLWTLIFAYYTFLACYSLYWIMTLLGFFFEGSLDSPKKSKLQNKIIEKSEELFLFGWAVCFALSVARISYLQANDKEIGVYAAAIVAISIIILLVGIWKLLNGGESTPKPSQNMTSKSGKDSIKAITNSTSSISNRKPLAVQAALPATAIKEPARRDTGLRKKKSTQATQRELDEWKRKWKTDAEIGREYERYIGYLCETFGYKVKYFGATEGVRDMGRDLIAKKDSDVYVIQCKYWGKDKIIREKHIGQLYATAVVMANKDREKRYSAVFVTNIHISDTAKEFASSTGVLVHEAVPMNDRPLIKCNRNKSGDRIYHLPFDPSYDIVEIG